MHDLHMVLGTGRAAACNAYCCCEYQALVAWLEARMRPLLLDTLLWTLLACKLLAELLNNGLYFKIARPFCSWLRAHS